MLNITINLLLSFFAAIIVMLVHELSKYYFSLTLLHPIYRKRHDTKINFLKYIDPIGLIIFIFSSVGWQKPGEYNPAKFKEKEKGLLYLSLVGFLSNIILILALIPLALSLRSMLQVSYAPDDMKMQVVVYIWIFVLKLIGFSFALIVVNLLPVPPLDMAKIIYAFNPSFYFTMIQNERIIQAVFILLIAFNILSEVVSVLYAPLAKMLM